MQDPFARTQLDLIIIIRYFQASVTDENFSHCLSYFEILITLIRYFVT